MDPNNLFCLFCGYPVPNHDDTFREDEHYFLANRPHVVSEKSSNDKITIQTMKCPNCHKVSVDIVGIGSQFHSQKSIQTISLRLSEVIMKKLTLS